MTPPASDVTALLDRSPAARRSRASVRAAIEGAVEELVAALRSHHTGTAERSNRLAGDDIPLGARVVCTVDAFDAMTNDRPYRPALARAEARRRISSGAGSQFDPNVVRALLFALSGRRAADRVGGTCASTTIPRPPTA